MPPGSDRREPIKSSGELLVPNTSLLTRSASQKGPPLLKGGCSLSWARTRATATESGPPREQPLAHW